MAEQFIIAFAPSGRGKARCAPNPAYPHGIALPSMRQPSCRVDLPYPAPECGTYVVLCTKCGTTVAIMAAGRPDDPVSAGIPCKLETASEALP